MTDHGSGPQQRGFARAQFGKAGLHRQIEPGSPRVRRERCRFARKGMAELLDQQRAAPGGLLDPVDHERIGDVQQLFDRGQRLVAAQWRQGQRLRLAGQHQLGFGLARQQHDFELEGAGQRYQRGQQIAAGVVGPLPIVEDQQQRARGGEPADCRSVVGGGHGSGRQGAEQCADHVMERLQGLRREIGFAIAARDVPAARLGQVRSLAGKAALADTRRPVDLEHARGLGGVIQPIEKRALFSNPSGVARQALPGAGSEAVGGIGAPGNCPSRHLGTVPGHRHRLRRPGYEELPVTAQGLPADEDLAGEGGVADPRCGVGGIAQDLILAAHYIAAADQHHSRVNPAVQAQRLVGRGKGGVERGHRGVQIERRLGRAAPGIFERLGIAEHRQHAVPVQPDDASAMSGDHPLSHGAQLFEQIGVLLGLQSRSDAGGIRQIGEQNGDQPADLVNFRHYRANRSSKAFSRVIEGITSARPDRDTRPSCSSKPSSRVTASRCVPIRAARSA